MAAVSTNVFYKIEENCSSPHDVLEGGGTPAAAGLLSDQYVIWYDDSSGTLSSNLTVSQLAESGIEIWIDESFTNKADAGFFASNPFDQSQQTTTTYYEWDGTGWGSSATCEPVITPGPNVDLEKNYRLDNISKPLLRTNPKLSTNVKLVVDENDRIYFDSINANRGLANSVYKRWELDKNSRYSYDLARYWNDNETPIDSTFDVLRRYSDTSVLDSYDKQFEEQYHYGTILNSSKLYSEQFRIFAPIWVDYNLPKKFVIYRIDDPNPSIGLKNTGTDKQERILRLVRNSRIVKVFDLTSSSPVGTYLNNHVQDELFPKSPLTISMEKDEKSSYNGIDLIKGGFVEKSEYIYNDFIKQDSTLIDANDFITDGFRRNKVASANLINLEFLFNDPTSDDYSVNRYFGLYVDDFDSGVGEASYCRNGVVKFKSIESYLDGSDPTFAIPEHRLIYNSGTLGYVKLRNSFYSIDPSKFYDAKKSTVSVNAADTEINSNLGIFTKGTSVELKSNPTAAPDFLKLTITDNPVDGDSIRISDVKKESVRLKIIQNVASEAVTISDSLGNLVTFTTGVDVDDTWNNLSVAWTGSTLADRYNLSLEESSSLIESVVITEKKANLIDNNISVSTISSIIALDEIYTNVNPLDGFISCDNLLDAKRFVDNTFSGNGSLSDVAFSLAETIKSFTNFDAFNVGEVVYIRNITSGYRLMNSALLINLSNVSNFILAENEDIDGELDLSADITGQYSTHFFSGGHSAGKSVYIRSNTISGVEVNNFIPTIYSNVYNQVLDIVENTDGDREYHKLILKDKSQLKDGEFKVFSENRVRIGLFSAYDIYDMNFDFYDTSNSDLKELELETKENIAYQPYDNTGDAEQQNIIIDAEDWEKSPIEYFANLLPVLTGEDPSQITPERISSEYDRLKENSQKEYAVNSRVVPTINKWVLKDAMTVREQPYYLNVNEAFGRTNFSPDITVEGRNEDAFTHEWFYIDNWPDYFKSALITDPTSYSDNYNRGFSYVNHIEGFSIDRSLFTSVTHDYFDRFMVGEGSETIVPIDLNGDDVSDLNSIFWSKARLRKKYTIIDEGNNSDFAKTILKGLKYTFKSRKLGQNTGSNEFVKNSEFNGYKFSALLKTNTNSSSNLVEYEFIKNKKHKFVILLITLNISDDFVNYINRKYLYELRHRLEFDGSDYVYPDVNIDGALDLSEVEWNNPSPYLVSGIPHSNGTLPRFDQQISTGDNEQYGKLKIEIRVGSQDLTYEADISRVIGSNLIELATIPKTTPGGVPIAGTHIERDPQLKNATYTYEGGGYNAHTVLLRELAARSFVEKLQTGSKDIKFTTINENGDEVQDEYRVEVDDGNEIIKTSKLVPLIDTETPKSYKLKKETIGYVIGETTPYYPFLIRHSGRYTIDFTPVVTFTDIYSFNKVNRVQQDSYQSSRELKEGYYKLDLSSQYDVEKSRAFYKKYNRLGVAFNVGFISDGGSHDSRWGMIKNHFYHKVNEINSSGVTKLSDSTEYLPLYPLINEIAIDKRDVNVFRSSWEDDYYIRSRDGGGFDLLPGTISTVEERSYLGSTVITFKPSYSISQFTTSIVNSRTELDDILRSVNPPSNAILFEDENTILIDFYVEDIVADIIGSDGLNRTITKFVDPAKSEGNKDSIVDDIELYATNNMVNLYSIDSIQLYVRQYKGSASEIVSTTDIDQIGAGGYVADQTFTYQLHNRKPLNFRLIYNKQLGYSYSIRALIKIQA